MIKLPRGTSLKEKKGMEDRREIIMRAKRNAAKKEIERRRKMYGSKK